MKFGEIFWLNKHKQPNIAKHWVVVIYANKMENVVYYQALSTRIYKVFPNFGTFKNEHCYNCAKQEQIKDHLRYKNHPVLYLDVDMVSFLNFKKYYFLRKETFICYKRIHKENFFDFNCKIVKGEYKKYGSLLENNKKTSIIAMRVSKELSMMEKNNILDFYKDV